MTDAYPTGQRMTGRPGTGPAVEAQAVKAQVVRFDRAERILHWVNATLVLTLIATGSIMYIGSLSAIFGRRVLIETIHLYAGLALPVPFAVTLAGRHGRAFRRDARRLGRFLADDWLWLRKQIRRSGALRIGKFNAGQKINAVLVAGALPVMLTTGLMLKWHRFFPDSLRTGATFVHDWGYVGLSLLVVGHIAKAVADPTALGAMWRGTVPARWAHEEHPRWHDELVAAGEVSGGQVGGGQVVGGEARDPAGPGPVGSSHADQPITPHA